MTNAAQIASDSSLESTRATLAQHPTASTARAGAAIPGQKLSAPLLLVLAALAALGLLATNIMLPSLRSIAGTFGVSTAEMGVALSAFLLVFAVGQLLVGPLSDAWGRRGLVLGGLVLFVAGSLLCALATDLPVLIAGRIVQALGVCAAYALARAIALDLFAGDALARMLALMMVAMAAAPGFSPLLGGALDHQFGWRSTFLAVAGLGAVVLVIYLALVGETHHSSRRVAFAPISIARRYRQLALDQRFLLPALAVMLLMGGLFAIFAASPTILMDGLGLSANQLGLFFAVTVLFVFAGGLLAPRLAARSGPGRIAIAGLVIAFIGGALLFALAAVGIRTFLAFAIPVAVFLFGFGLANPLAIAITLSPFRDMAGLASALLGFLQMAGAALGAALVTSLAMAPVAALGSMLASFLGVAIILLVGRREASQRPASLLESGRPIR